MGRGRSGLGGGNNTKSAVPSKANTPSGIDYKSFMSMSDQQRYDTIDNILDDPNIKVPSYLDNSDTSKLMYALGMNNKPKVVSDDQLEKIQGKDLYRTVYDTPNPPPSSLDILDQIRNGDYAQMSGRGGSVHGRAIYFSEGMFAGSAAYGAGRKNALVMRAKVNPGANIMDSKELERKMFSDPAFNKNFNKKNAGADAIALYALANGIDGWRSKGGYMMIVNRGALTASSKNKKIVKKNSVFDSWDVTPWGGDVADHWSKAADA